MNPPPANSPPVDPATAARPRVLDRSDYQLIFGSFALLAVFVVLLVLLLSTFKQMMASHWLRTYERRPKVELRAYIEILANESAADWLEAWRSKPEGMPPLFAAMALAVKGGEGAARLLTDAESGAGEPRIAALAALEFARPGSLLPMLRSAAEPERWAEAVHAAALADAYAAEDFPREMDGHFIALFPGKKAIPAAVMNGYQSGLDRIFTDADEPDKLAAVREFHASQLREHPELYKSGVLQKIKDQWDAYLARVFEQRRAAHSGQDAVRAAAVQAASLPPSAWELANRFLAARYAGNPVNLAVAAASGRVGVPTAAGETILRRDGAPLRALAASADGATLASGGFDNLVRVWPAGREGDARAMTGHVFGVMAVAVSPDGSRIASAGLDETIRMWDARDGRETACVPAGTRRVSALAWSPDGATLAAGGAGGAIRLLDADSGAERLALRRHASEATSLAFTADGGRLVSASLDKTLCVWDIADGTAAPRVLDRHADAVWATAVSPDGRWLASGGPDRRILLWGLQDPKSKIRTLKGHKGAVTALAASPDGMLLASAGSDGALLVWDASDKGAFRAAHPTAGTVNALRFTPDGKSLLLAGDDGTLRRWDISFRDERPFSFGDWVLWLFGKS